MGSKEYDRVVERLGRPETREEALRELAENPIRGAAALAAPFLRDPDSLVRKEALECLLRRGSTRYMPQVARCLRDPDALVRVTAVECVARWKGDNCRRQLVRMLRDRDALVRAYAAWALKELGATEAVSKLLSRVGRERDGVAKAGLLEALAVLEGSAKWVVRLCLLLKHREGNVRSFAANSLVGVANEATPEVCKEIKQSLRAALLVETAPGARENLRRNLAMIS